MVASALEDFMSDITASAPSAAPGAPLQSLAERLATLAPPIAAATTLANPPVLRPSPAVAAALKRSAKMAARAAKHARRSRYPQPLTTAIVESFVSACSFVPYALVALALRLIMARLFFFPGQTMIDGPRVPISIPDFLNLNYAFNTSVVLPLHVKAATFDMFFTQYAMVPVPPVLAAYLASYAAFVLPLLLVLGLATRFAALGLLIMTAMIYLVLPEAVWTAQIYWGALLMVLLSQGPGAISIDHIVRYMNRR
jgi:putative oxidoreductase